MVVVWILAWVGQPSAPRTSTRANSGGSVEHYGTCAATTTDRAARDDAAMSSASRLRLFATECADKNPPGNETAPSVSEQTTILVNQPENGPQSVAALSTKNKYDEPSVPGRGELPLPNLREDVLGDNTFWKWE
ncbi:hypothetical protein Pelo_18476 [Pelomyxa schiedti]|nr:hypothetical protein Pelo_18476 [Pelomyxa schiedti]